jgi:hypothetical protein
VKRHPASTADDISMGVSLEVAEVLALTEELCDRGVLVSSDHGEARFELSASEEARYREFDDPTASSSTP